MQHGRIVPHCSAVLDTTLRRTPCRPASALGPAAPRCFADCCAAASSSRAPANSSPLCLADYCAAASASPRCWANRNDSLQPAPERARGPRAPCAGSRPGCGPAPPAYAGARPAPGACAPAAPPSPPPAAASPARAAPRAGSARGAARAGRSAPEVHLPPRASRFAFDRAPHPCTLNHPQLPHHMHTTYRPWGT